MGLDMTRLSQWVGYATTRAAIALKFAFAQHMAPLGLKSVEFSVLVLIATNPKVFTMLSNACASLTDELTVTMTSNKLTMSDDERIKRIDLLYTDMQDKYVFVNSFSNDITKMSLQRNRELNESASVRNLYGQ